MHCDYDIPETICAGLLYGEALADSVNQQLIAARRLLEKPQVAIPVNTTESLHLCHHFWTTTLIQINHLNACVQSSLHKLIF